MDLGSLCRHTDGQKVSDINPLISFCLVLDFLTPQV